MTKKTVAVTPTLTATQKRKLIAGAVAPLERQIADLERDLRYANNRAAESKEREGKAEESLKCARQDAERLRNELSQARQAVSQGSIKMIRETLERLGAVPVQGAEVNHRYDIREPNDGMRRNR